MDPKHRKGKPGSGGLGCLLTTAVTQRSSATALLDDADDILLVLILIDCISRRWDRLLDSDMGKKTLLLHFSRSTFNRVHDLVGPRRKQQRPDGAFET